MFEDYLEDAYCLAEQATKEADVRLKKRYYRAAVLYSAAAVEAFLNYMAETLKAGNALEPFELAYLSDRRFGLTQGRFEELSSIERHRTEDKLRILLTKFRPQYDVNTEASWSHLAELRSLRDGIVHPRNQEDEVTPEQYRESLSRGIAAAVCVMDHVCQGAFQRGLRPKLRDLAR